MDIPALATSAVALLSPYLVKGSEEFAKKVGGAAFGGVEKLYGLVKGKLTGPAEAATLSSLEAKPDDTRRQGALEVFIEEALKADPDFAAELKALVENVKKKGGAPVTQIMNITGDHNKSTQISGSGNIVNT
ncbi:MAG: hypothetical protein ACR2RA_25315 [Geminicoccaceae bacterium]